MGFETQTIERKTVAILNTMENSQEAVFSTTVARRLQERGIELSDRAVRYYLRQMDEKGFTRLIGKRDGRIITELDQAELKKTTALNKISLAFSRIETLAFHTDIDLDKRTGFIPANISLFRKEDFNKVLKAIKPVFRAGFSVSELVGIANEGEALGDMIVPEGKTAIATICSVVVHGALLKYGVPINAQFGGILQIQNSVPIRFVELIHYNRSSLDPSEIFIRANMTSVTMAAKRGSGKILANYREIPAISRQLVEEVMTKLKDARLGGVFMMGNVSEPVCEIPVGLNRIGMVLLGGLNPMAATTEAGIMSESYAMHCLINYTSLVKITDI